MSNENEIVIRPAVISDKEFIVSLVPRLAAFGPPDWRNVDTMTAIDSQLLVDHLESRAPEIAIFIAEDNDGRSLGLIHLQPATDYYNGEPHGHITDLIVGSDGEGRGVGRALLAKAEKWARELGFAWITLSVFGQNTRARQLYERVGYGEDMIKYIKILH